MKAIRVDSKDAALKALRAMCDDIFDYGDDPKVTAAVVTALSKAIGDVEKIEANL